VKVLLMTGLAMLVAVVLFDILSVPVESGLVSYYNYAPAPMFVPSTGAVAPAGATPILNQTTTAPSAAPLSVTPAPDAGLR
jgi:hypothetical protein